MKRYFMTIPEAVSLVLQCGQFANKAEIFVLEMGEPVNIDRLARELIRLSGYIPDQDIKIVYTGIRPGEKLYEEIFTESEKFEKTKNKWIFISKNNNKMSNIEFESFINKIKNIVQRNDIEKIPYIFKEVISDAQLDLKSDTTYS
jgi:FlaA1/EpsC-like NDP-sugar epimerase